METQGGLLATGTFAHVSIRFFHPSFSHALHSFVVAQKLDIAALREGSFVELVNVSPIDSMVITLSQACVENVVGFGLVGSGLVRRWVQEICATQLHKFIANARPFEPFADVGQGVTDLIVLPYEAFKNGDDIRQAMGSGIKSLAETFAFQTLTTTSRLTQYAANKMAGTVRGRRRVNVALNPLPSRPSSAPKGVSDVTGHAMESLARGIQAANYKVVIVPYREYARNGATGAATSVLKGIPVLLVAPLTGATEALSYTLLGARNALRPDIRKEEEAIRNGITGYDI
jgi:autophagy-related protein 2